MSFLPRFLLAGLAGGISAGGLTWFFLGGLGSEPPEWLIMFSGPIAGLTVMHLTRPSAPAEEAPAVPKQLVGKTCAQCEEKVRAAPDATGCEECGAVLHKGCVADHACA